MDAIKEILERWDFLGYIAAGLIGAIISFLLDQVFSFFRRRRKKYCLSKFLDSSYVYQQVDEGGLKIRVSYNDTEVEGPLSILVIRLTNDGSEDLSFSQRFSYLRIIINELELLDVSVFSKVAGVNPVIISGCEGSYELKWDLLKSDECFFIKIVTRGKIDDISAIKFDVRAEGINQIKTPEYKVNEVMKPVLVGAAIIAIFSFFIPASDSFLEIMSMRAFFLVCDASFVLLILVSAIFQRIKWLKEQ